MLTAYVDESGQEGRDEVIIAGYMGNDAAWSRFVPEWRRALGPRKSLHMRELRWKHPRVKKLIAKLGPIPEQAGLQGIVGGVRVSDYEDMIPPEYFNRTGTGYMMAIHPLIISALRSIPDGERLRVIFDEQRAFANLRESAMTALSQMFVNRDGVSQLAEWGSMPKGSPLFEPADALAYSILQREREPNSERAKICSPMLGSQPIRGEFINRQRIREVLQVSMFLIPPQLLFGVPTREPNTERQRRI